MATFRDSLVLVLTAAEQKLREIEERGQTEDAAAIDVLTAAARVVSAHLENCILPGDRDDSRVGVTGTSDGAIIRTLVGDFITAAGVKMAVWLVRERQRVEYVTGVTSDWVTVQEWYENQSGQPVVLDENKLGGMVKLDRHDLRIERCDR